MKKRCFAAAVLLCSSMAVSVTFAADDFFAPLQETEQGGTGEIICCEHTFSQLRHFKHACGS